MAKDSKVGHLTRTLPKEKAPGPTGINPKSFSSLSCRARERKSRWWVATTPGRLQLI
ncbi:NAD_binding_11 domain-containing protein [Psidium guajava]|nr:NAD_binding_11 domain-containing protein [Psidium guajava]